MPKVDDKHIGVARVYSRSLLALAEKKGVADDVLEELGEIARHVDGDPRFASFISSPLKIASLLPEDDDITAAHP